jgi:hypothetical protein
LASDLPPVAIDTNVAIATGVCWRQMSVIGPPWIRSFPVNLTDLRAGVFFFPGVGISSGDLR